MLEKIIKRKYYLEHHHLNAPLLAEREAYLTTMFSRGLSPDFGNDSPYLFTPMYEASFKGTKR